MQLIVIGRKKHCCLNMALMLIKGPYGQTALKRAAELNSEKVARLLLEQAGVK